MVVFDDAPVGETAFQPPCPDNRDFTLKVDKGLQHQFLFRYGSQSGCCLLLEK